MVCIWKKRTMSTKKAIYALFFSSWRYSHTSSGTEGHKCYWLVLQWCFTKKLKKCYLKRRPVIAFQHVCLLHDNASAHTSEIVKPFLSRRILIVLPHPPYSPDQVLCDIFLFSKTKNSSYLVFDITPGKLLAQPLVNVSEVYPNQPTVISKEDSQTEVMYVSIREKYFEGM